MPGKTNELILADLEKEIKESNFVVFSRFAGLKVSDLEELRRSLRTSTRRCMVVKKSLARLVFSQLGGPDVSSFLDGMSCLTTADKDPQVVSKTLVAFAKGREDNFQLRGAVIDGKAVSAGYLSDLAKLPSKRELQAKVVGTIKGPINRFVLDLRGLLQSLVIVLNAAKDKSAKQPA